MTPLLLPDYPIEKTQRFPVGGVADAIAGMFHSDILKLHNEGKSSKSVASKF
jgi:hypothetical protein